MKRLRCAIHERVEALLIQHGVDKRQRLQVVDVSHRSSKRWRNACVDVELVERVSKAGSHFSGVFYICLGFSKFLERQEVGKQIVLVDLLEILDDW